MGFRGAATWDLEAQQQVGWDLKGQQRDLEAQQHGTGLPRGYLASQDALEVMRVTY